MKVPQRHKIVVLGGHQVGKTSIMSRYIDGNMSEHYQATIGIDFIAKSVPRSRGTLRLHIWDTSGQENFQTLARAYVDSASAAIVVYDVTQPQTLEQAEWWIEKVHEVCGHAPVIALVGNKADMVNEFGVRREREENWAQEWGAQFFMETSAKTGKNIEALFRKLVNALPIETEGKSLGESAILIPEREETNRACRCWPRRKYQP